MMLLNSLTKGASVTDRRSILLILGVALLLIPWNAFAAGEVAKEMKWGAMTMSLLGGLALFLYGMEMMADSLKAVAGDKMKTILAKLTTNPVSGVLTGAFVTSIIQSSSVTTVLVVGFITAGVMTFQQSLGVIFGANIGTTITAQIVAFKITEAASLMVAFGFLGSMLAKKEHVRHYSLMLMGLGLIFLGMNIMGDAMKPLRNYEPFLNLMRTMESPMIGIMISLLFTALIQSSSATTGIVIVMASQGFITLEAGIALAFGANIGTCATALLASIGRPREAVRAAIAHTLFNVFGVIIWYAFIPLLAEFVTWMSPVSEGLDGMAKMAAETPRQIANAHTIFNVANTLIFLPLVGYYAKMVNWLLPTGKPVAAAELTAKEVANHLNDVLLDTPSLALDAVRREVRNMGLRVNLMMDGVLPVVLHGDNQKLRKLAEKDNEIDQLYATMINYLGRISQKNLTEKQSEEMMSLVNIVSNLEAIGDLIETNLVNLGQTRLDKGVEVSEPTEKNLLDYYKMISKSVDMSVRAVTEDEGVAELVKEIRLMQDKIDQQMNDASIYHVQRLSAEAPSRVESFTIEMDLWENLRRIYYCSLAIVRHSTGEIRYTRELVFRRDLAPQAD